MKAAKLPVAVACVLVMLSSGLARAEAQGLDLGRQIRDAQAAVRRGG